MEKLSIFISYSESDSGEYASGLKSQLCSLYGINVFLAHEDIPGGTNWQSCILERLAACDVFLCLISANYQKSLFCDQELGFALALGKRVLPIKIDLSPYGFISHIQAFSHDQENVVLSIIKTLIVDDQSCEKLFNSLIVKLCNETIFEEMIKFVAILIQYTDKLNKVQREALKEAYALNWHVKRTYNMPILIQKISD